jgi:hypothetical protein
MHEENRQSIQYYIQIDDMMDGINIYDAYRPCWENNKNGPTMKFSQMLKKVHRKGPK